MPEVFISSSMDDQELAAKLREELSRENIRVWLDTDKVMPGENWADKLQEALDSAELFVFLMSSTSLSSPNVAFELGYAIGRAKHANARLVPVLIGDAKLTPSLEQFEVLDGRNLEPKALADRIKHAVNVTSRPH